MSKKIFVFFLLFVFLINCISASLKFDAKYLSSDEKNLFLDLKDGNLDKFSVIDFILISSGLNTKSRDYKFYKNKFKNIKKDFGKYYKKSSKNYLDKKNESYDKASFLLNFLHDNYLRELNNNSSDNFSILDTIGIGKFNVLYSTILYCLLADEVGLKVDILGIPNYVFLVLHTDSKDIYIDTTLKNGFDVDKTSIIKNNSKEIGNIYNIINGSDVREMSIGIRELFSLIYLRDFIFKNEVLYSDEVINNYLKAMFINPKSEFIRLLFSNYLLNYSTQELNLNHIEKSLELLYNSKKVKKDNIIVYDKAVEIFATSIEILLKDNDFNTAEKRIKTYLDFFDYNLELQKNKYIDKIKRICIKKIVFYLNNREDLTNIKNLCNLAINFGKNQELDKKLEGFFIEINKLEKDREEKQILKEIVSIFNIGDYENVILKSDEILKNNRVSSDILIKEINTYKNSANKIILFEVLIDKYNKGDFKNITYRQIKEIENLNLITGNNVEITNKLVEIRRKLREFGRKKQ